MIETLTVGTEYLGILSNNSNHYSCIFFIIHSNRVMIYRQTVEVNLPEQPFQFQVKINHFETPQGLFIRPEIIPSPNLIQLPSSESLFCK